MSQHTSAEVLPLLPSDNGEAQTITFYMQWTKQDWKVRRKCEVGSFWRSLGFHYFSALISASHKNNSAQLWTCLCREFDWEEPNAFRSRPLMAIEAERERCSSRSFGLDSGSELHRENTFLSFPLSLQIILLSPLLNYLPHVAVMTKSWNRTQAQPWMFIRQVFNTEQEIHCAIGKGNVSSY